MEGLLRVNAGHGPRRRGALPQVKALARKLLTVTGPAIRATPLLRDQATILTLHRFRDPERGIAGIDPALVEAGLSYLRHHRYEIVELDEIFRRLTWGEPRLDGAVAFTIDDGYAEQATVAAPIFARYDCPVTTFVVSGFLDGALWPWWDKIDHVLRTTRRRQVRFGGTEGSYRWDDDATRELIRAHVTEACKRLPDAAKDAAVIALGESADVEIPAAPPPRYQPMSWDDVRQSERGGMRFGPHSVTHPILSRTSEEQMRREVIDSWARVAAEAARPMPVFCYPNGGADDFGPREMALLDELGFLGGLALGQDYADARAVRRHPGARWKVPRFGYPEDDRAPLIHLVTGAERLKQLVRRRDAA